MFTVDEATAEAIRRAYEDSGELAAWSSCAATFLSLPTTPMPAVSAGDREMEADAAQPQVQSGRRPSKKT